MESQNRVLVYQEAIVLMNVVYFINAHFLRGCKVGDMNESLFLNDAKIESIIFLLTIKHYQIIKDFLTHP